MNRIYIQLSTEQLKASDKGRYYLAYLLIRLKAKSKAGFFNADDFYSAVQLKERSGKVLLNTLIGKEWVKQVSKDRFRVVSQRTLTGTSRRLTYFDLTDTQLKAYSLKSMCRFRAMLTELECQRYKNHQRAKIKGYHVTDKRTGQKELIRNKELRALYPLMASTCTAALVDVNHSTARKYRKNQNLSIYSSEKARNFKAVSSDVKSKGKEIVLSDYPGLIFQGKAGLLYCPISQRQSKFILKRG